MLETQSRERGYEIPWGESLRRWIGGIRDEWFYDLCGGLKGATETLEISKQAAHRLYQHGVKDRETAITMHDVFLEKKGRDIPVAELLELPGVEWHGPERHGGGSGNGRKSVSRGRPGSSSGSNRAGTLHAAPAPAMAVGWN